ncbi:suppressor of fused domain protein [Amycolatopsis sp. NBC_01480]|uniref:suppressor of fused domain protein n=1 Tax=Amycolatopsis sp. NBC_01480 TaxID=2903562 RepID=UPI002E2DA8D4|nr:suppressor of fused domain protein [Amycolatopsis sp. NBC_01480]
MNDSRIDEHLTRHLGAGEVDTRIGNVEIWRHERPEFVSFATHGLAGLPIAAVYPQEFVCSVKPGQDGAALYIVRATLELVLQGRRGLVNNQIIPNGQPLLARTDISGILVGPHPYLEDTFSVVFDGDRQVLAEIMTLIPLTSTEIARASEAGADALIDFLEETDPPLLDVTR